MPLAAAPLSGAQHALPDEARFLQRTPGGGPPPPPAPPSPPQQLLATWRAKNLVVIEDVHAVAAYLAPALVRGPVHCRLDEVAERTGLTLDRVHDCLRMLIKGGVRQAGVAAEGVPVCVPP
ncbi:hypothetical protein ACWDZ8_13800 [Streptomyces sp. NPDC003233]